MLETAGERASASPEVIRLYVDCLIRVKDWETVKEFTESNGGLIDDDFVKLRIAVEMGAYSEIQGLVAQSAGVIDPNSHPMLYAKARMEQHEGNPEAAYELGMKALELAPRKRDYLELMKELAESLGKHEVVAVCQENIERINGFRQEFKELVVNGTANVDDAEVRFRLAELCYEFGSYEQAMSWFGRATGIEPELSSQADERVAELHSIHGLIVPLPSENDDPQAENTDSANRGNKGRC